MTFAERIDNKKTRSGVLVEASTQKVDTTVGNIIKYFSTHDEFALKYLEQNSNPNDLPKNVQKVHRKLYQKYYRTDLKRSERITWFQKLINKIVTSFGGIAVLSFLLSIAFFVGKVVLFDNLIKQIMATKGSIKDNDLKYIFGEQPVHQQIFTVSATGFITFFVVTLVYVAMKISANILNYVSHPIEKPMELQEFLSLFNINPNGHLVPKENKSMVPILDVKTGQTFICWHTGQWFPHKPTHLFSPGTLRQIEIDSKLRSKHSYKDPSKYKLIGRRDNV